MSHEDRQQRSQQRAEEYSRRKKLRFILFVAGLSLYVGVPLLWYGAVEFGWVRPIQTPEFKNALSVASAVLLLAIIFLFPEHYPWGILGKNKETGTTKLASPAEK